MKCRLVLEGKARALREKETKALTVQDEEQLWKNGVLGEQNPKSLKISGQFFLVCPFSTTVQRLQPAKQ